MSEQVATRNLIELRAVHKDAAMVVDAYLKYRDIAEHADYEEFDSVTGEAFDTLCARIEELKETLLEQSKKRGKRGGK